MGGKRTTFQDPETGRWTRICSNCREVKDLEDDFYIAYPKVTGPTRWGYECKQCKRAYSAALALRQRADPKRGPELRAMYTRLMREWRRRHPERARENAKRYRERRQNDPKRRARYLENVRIAYRLRAEREGRVVRPLTSVILGRDELPKLPAMPLAELLESLAKQCEGGIEALARELGFNTRNYRAWRSGERQTVQFEQVDQVLTAAGLMWWEVWDEDSYPEVHERMDIAA